MVCSAPGTPRLDSQDRAQRRPYDSRGCVDIHVAVVETNRLAFSTTDTLLLQNGAGRFAFRRNG